MEATRQRQILVRPEVYILDIYRENTAVLKRAELKERLWISSPIKGCSRNV